MIRQIHLDPRVDKQLAALKRAGKKADIAARRARRIMTRLKQGTLTPDHLGIVTKHGELRLKGCMKYDLGSGYRLITLKQGQDLYILYCGSHDDCHRWIENNRELQLDFVLLRSQSYKVRDQRGATNEPLSRIGDGGKDLYDAMDDIVECEQPDDALLRKIFRGLTSAV